MKITKIIDKTGNIKLTFKNLPTFPEGTKFVQNQGISGTKNIIYLEGLYKIIWGDFEYNINERSGDASINLRSNRNVEKIADEIITRYNDFEEKRQKWIDEHDNQTCIVIFSAQKRDKSGRFTK